MKSVCRSGRGARVRRALELGCALGFALTVLLTAAAWRYQSLCRRVCGDTLRLHIVANSDSTADQLQKLAVRDALLEAVAAITAQARNRDEPWPPFPARCPGCRPKRAAPRAANPCGSA